MLALSIHGGAGTITRALLTPEKEQRYREALEAALEAGYAVLERGGSALDAVEAAVVSLEDCPLFNAGRGAVFNAQGKHELDASIMRGDTRQAGAVAMVSNIKNPIRLARMVMERSEHVLLAGEGAMEFAKTMPCEWADDAYFYDEFRYQQWQTLRGTEQMQLDHSEENKERKFGTVGAVALDQYGNLAAATSTGGMTNKRFGRVGDSPIIGAGTYANNATCAISCTGSGEYFLRGVVAYDVSCLMEYKGLGLQAACEEVIQKRLLDIGGDGGLIGVDAQGNLAMVFNTEGMYRACKNSNGVKEVGIYGGRFMPPLSFNTNGFLKPQGPISSTIEQFESTFVTPFGGQRAIIFSEYQKYLADLKNVLQNVPFIQYINGSFVTKKINPKDLDVVTIIPEADFKRLESKLASFFVKDASFNYDSSLLDAYIIPDKTTAKTEFIWDFSRIKQAPYKNPFAQKNKSKGFIELSF